MRIGYTFIYFLLKLFFHYPSLSDVDILDTWRAMEKLVELGLTKSIGVSNFNSEQLSRLLANCTIKPVQNQVFHIIY